MLVSEAQSQYGDSLYPSCLRGVPNDGEGSKHGKGSSNNTEDALPGDEEVPDHGPEIHADDAAKSAEETSHEEGSGEENVLRDDTKFYTEFEYVEVSFLRIIRCNVVDNARREARYGRELQRLKRDEWIPDVWKIRKRVGLLRGLALGLLPPVHRCPPYLTATWKILHPPKDPRIIADRAPRPS